MSDIATILKLLMSHDRLIKVVSMYTHDMIVLLSSGTMKCKCCDRRLVTVARDDVTACDRCAAQAIVTEKLVDVSYVDVQNADIARRLNEVIDLQFDSDQNVVIQ